jgi:hypothetical protein
MGYLPLKLWTQKWKIKREHDDAHSGSGFFVSPGVYMMFPLMGSPSDSNTHHYNYNLPKERSRSDLAQLEALFGTPDSRWMLRWKIRVEGFSQQNVNIHNIDKIRVSH